MIEWYQPWNRWWSLFGRPSMSTSTLIGNQVVNSATRSARPRPANPSTRSWAARCTTPSTSSAALRVTTGRNASSPLPRKNGLSSARWVASSSPSICRIVRPWTGSSCHSWSRLENAAVRKAPATSAYRLISQLWVASWNVTGCESRSTRWKG